MDSNSFDDFFGSGESYDNYGYDEYGEVESDKNQNTNNYDYDYSYIVRDKSKYTGLFNIISTIILVIVLLIVISSLAIGEPGIKAPSNEKLNISNVSYTPLSEMLFMVENKTSRDVSVSTIWYLNDTEIARGTNGTMLDMDLINWGSNTLKAVNEDDIVTWNIEFRKFQTDKDPIHNMLSMMTQYPDKAYAESLGEYENLGDNFVSELVEGYRNTIVYNNGTLRTTQKLGDIELETMEKLGYSLHLGDALEIPDVYKGEKAVTVTGNWNNVISANISIPFNEDFSQTQVLRFNNSKTERLSSDEYYTFNNKIVIPITESGTYILQYGKTDYTKSSLICNISSIIIKPSDYMLMDTFDNVPIEVVYEIPVDMKYKGFIDLVKGKLNKSTIPVTVNEYYYSGGYGYYDGTYWDFENSGVEYALRNGSFIEQDNKIQVAYIYILDFDGCGIDKINETFRIMNSIADLNSDYKFNLIILNTNINGIKNITNISSNINIYEVSDISEVEDSLESMLSNIQVGQDSAIGSNNTEYNSIILGDSGFINNIHGLNIPCSFNEEFQSSDAFGIALLSKLVYQSDFKRDLIDSGDVIGDHILTGTFNWLKLLDSRAVSTITEDDMIQIQNSGINAIADKFKTIVSALTLSQLNTLENGLYRPSAIKQSGDYTFVMSDVIANIRRGKPVIAILENQYGSTPVLITRVECDKSDRMNYYLYLYNPIYPDETHIANLKFYRGVLNKFSLGYGYEFEYTINDTVFSDIAFMPYIEIYNGNNLSFSESLYDFR